MTRFDEPYKLERCNPQTTDQTKACAYVKSLFGTQPASVRSLTGSTGEVCLVKVGGLLGPGVEFIVAGGLLVGIPPKRMGGK